MANYTARWKFGLLLQTARWTFRGPTNNLHRSCKAVVDWVVDAGEGLQLIILVMVVSAEIGPRGGVESATFPLFLAEDLGARGSEEELDSFLRAVRSNDTSFREVTTALLSKSEQPFFCSSRLTI